MNWKRSTFCANGGCVEVGWQRATACSSGGCVEVSHQDGVIVVRDSKNPKARRIEWSTDMWSSSVLGRIADGYLPAYAVEVGVEKPSMLVLPAWQGGAVTWGQLEFTAEEWRAFVDGVSAGEFSVATLTGDIRPELDKVKADVARLDERTKPAPPVDPPVDPPVRGKPS